MIYPHNFEQKIGFDTIRQMLKQACLSLMGENFVDKILFSNNYELIVKLINQVAEFKDILLSDDNFPSQDYIDLRPELERIKIKGTYINKTELFDLKLSLTTIQQCINFLKNKEDKKYPYLKKLTENIYVDKSIISKIDQIIDEKGNIRDNASKELLVIRKELNFKQSVIDKKISQILNSAKKQGWVKEDISITIRNGRSVIPVSAAYKRKIKGFIHDESATGQTVFIEPTIVFDINNEIRDLENAEKREIIKILIKFTDFLRPQIEELIKAYFFLGLIDFIRAKAKFAIHIQAVKPIINNNAVIGWIEAKHPLLYLSHKAQNKKVVPLNISLNQGQRILIISGPNAGGKSVCLKTVGLLQYMIQTGLLVPMKENSETGIFDNLFIDIGDEQSLENDLSSYSSHLINMKKFVLNADSKSLFLIDEFGAGTEPHLGGAIAEAVLEKLNENKSFGIVTTHYSNLKLLAEKQKGIVNGAMLFDSKLMQPVYELKIGKPGSSFAFEIAKKIGFPKKLLKNAAKKTGKKQLDFDKQLQELETEQKKLEKKHTELKVADDFLAEMIDKYQNLSEDLEKAKKSIIQQAREEALELINNSNKLIEKTIKEIKENQASKEQTKKLRQKLKIFSENIKKEHKKSEKQKSSIEKIKNTAVQTGDFVKIKEQDAVGEITEINGEEAIVTFNSIKLKTSLEKLEKVSKKQAQKEKTKYKKSSYNPVINELNDKIANFNLSIDVRGKRAEEAINIVKHYIDEAILLNVSEVSILHGKGNGVLYNIIREYLSSIPEIKQFGDESLERGGHGITIVKFK